MSPLHAVAFKGKILVIKLLKGDINISVSEFDKENKRFAKLQDTELKLDIDGKDAQILAFSCIVEESTALLQPCLVIEHYHSESDSTVQFYFLSNEKTLTKVASFRNNLRVASTQYKLCDGPSFSWLDKEGIHFFRVGYPPRPINLEYSSFKCTKLLWSGFKQCQMLTVACCKDKVFAIDVERTGHLSDIIPNIYSSIVACLHLHYSINRDCLAAYNTEYSYDFYIGTTKGQLIKFTDGKLISYWQLPFNDPIIVEIFESRNGSKSAVVQSEQKLVCLINLSQNKIVNEWSNQDLVLIDDFQENGTKQLCLMQDNQSPDDLIKSFILISMDGNTVTSGQEPLVGNTSLAAKQPMNECILSTLQALRARLQASKSHLSELRMECNNKAQLIHSTCKVLYNISDHSSENKPFNNQHKTSNLVCLIGDQSSSEILQDKKPGNQSKCKESDFPFKKATVWQRVIGNNWIIGVDIKHVKISDMSDICLSLVSCTNENLISTCQCLNEANNQRPSAINQHQQILPRSPKWQRIEPVSECQVALVTSLPTFSKLKHFTGLVTLSWTSCHDNSSRQITSCEYVHLDIDQIIREELSVLGSGQTQQDLAAIKAISSLTKLSISQAPVPFNIFDSLRNEFGLVPVGDVRAGGSEEILLQAFGVRGYEQGVGFLVESTAQQSEIQLFTRNQNQVYMNIHKIRDALPDDVIIKISDVRPKAESQALQSIRTLITCVMENLMKTLSKRQYNVPAIDLTNDGDDKIRNIRKIYKEKRKRFFAKESFS